MPYTGETIDVNATLMRFNQAAKAHGFISMPLVEQKGFIIPVLTRAAKQPDPYRVYISSGIHGDEPAGPLAILDLLEKGQLCEKTDWTLFPMLNPSGLQLNQRENHEGVDLNRDYTNPSTKEVQAHRAYIEDQKSWDLALTLHEDWESDGFYLYDKPKELTQGWAKTIVDQVSKICPIDLNDRIDQMPASKGIISPKFEDIELDPKLKGQWPEPIYLHLAGKIQGTFTFEAPSAFDLPTRVNALNRAILTCIDLLNK